MTRTISPCATILRQMCYAIGVFALTLITPMSYAATNCYDFSKPAADTQYHVGGTLQTEHGVINLLELVNEDGNATQPNPQGATIHNNVPIPGQGENPSFLNHGGLTVQVVPETRKSSVTFKFAENTGITDNQLWNF